MRGKNPEGNRRSCPRKCDAVREYKAVHEENFLSSWLREDVRGKEERVAKAGEKNEERSEKRKREEEKEGNPTERVTRKNERFFFFGGL